MLIHKTKLAVFLTCLATEAIADYSANVTNCQTCTFTDETHLDNFLQDAEGTNLCTITTKPVNGHPAQLMPKPRVPCEHIKSLCEQDLGNWT